MDMSTETQESPAGKAEGENEIKRRFVNAPLTALGVPCRSSFPRGEDAAHLPYLSLPPHHEMQ